MYAAAAAMVSGQHLTSEHTVGRSEKAYTVTNKEMKTDKLQ